MYDKISNDGRKFLRSMKSITSLCVTCALRASTALVQSAYAGKSDEQKIPESKVVVNINLVKVSSTQGLEVRENSGIEMEI